MAILIVCGVDENGHRDIIAVEPMTEESRSSYVVLFQNLKDRGLSTPRLIIFDAHSGLVSAIRDFFPGASWQRCDVIDSYANRFPKAVQCLEDGLED